MHLALELDQSKQVSADPEEGPRPGAHGAPEADRRVRRRGAAGPEGGRQPHRRRARRHHRPGAGQGHRAAERVPRVPDHRQDRRAGEGAAGDGPHACAAWASRATPARASRPRSSSSWGATPPRRPPTDTGGAKADKTAKAAKAPAKDAGHGTRKPDSARADTAPVVGGVLSGLIQPAGAVAGSSTPGEYVVPETAFPRVDSLINIPAVARQLPRNLVLRWSAAPTSVGVQSYRYLYVLDDRPIITGSNLEDARRPARSAHQRADRHLPARPRRAAASSATRPAATWATSWPSCSTGGSRAARR